MFSGTRKEANVGGSFWSRIRVIVKFGLGGFGLLVGISLGVWVLSLVGIYMVLGLEVSEVTYRKTCFLPRAKGVLRARSVAMMGGFWVARLVLWSREGRRDPRRL